MSIFREYDIRGIADTQLTDSLTWGLGFVLGELAKKAGETNIYIGQDVRLSSPRLVKALAAGLRAAKLNVLVLSPGPTPLLYFAATKAISDFATKSGIMITGSHNPPEYNGFKMVIAGQTLFGSNIMAMKEAVLQAAEQAPAPDRRRAQEKEIDRELDYINYCKDTLRISRPIKVVIDAGNGAAGPLALATYRALGCEVIPLFCEPDGTFPNHHPDPTVAANLQHLIAEVLKSGAELGIAFDGDGDRIGAVSAKGEILYGDHLVMYFARDILKEVPGATIISEVKSSQVLYDQLEAWGAKPIMWKTGHSLIKAKLKETGAALAGEMSGHMFFAHRFFGFDDAIYAGARLIEGLSNKAESLSAFLASLPKTINTPELRIDCSDEKKFNVVSKFTDQARAKYGDSVNSIDGARIKLHQGWGLVRASNTQPVLVMRFEGPSLAAVKLIRDEFAEIFSSIDASIRVPEIHGS